jgi:hypothetical protein
MTLCAPDFRPAGPAMNRPGRKAGKAHELQRSTEGAAQRQVLHGKAFRAHILQHPCKCRAFGAPFFRTPLPGLTAGPIQYRAFGPQNRSHPSFETTSAAAAHMLCRLEAPVGGRRSDVGDPIFKAPAHAPTAYPCASNTCQNRLACNYGFFLIRALISAGRAKRSGGRFTLCSMLSTVATLSGPTVLITFLRGIRMPSMRW